jgi:hypothetical protein
MDRKELLEQIEKAREELEDARKRLPAHTVRPHQLQALEEIEDRLTDLKKQLRELDGA